MIPLHWKWRDLGRAIKAARWAFHHADDLAILKENLENENFGWANMTLEQTRRVRKAQAERFLGSYPLKRKSPTVKESK